MGVLVSMVFCVPFWGIVCMIFNSVGRIIAGDDKERRDFADGSIGVVLGTLVTISIAGFAVVSEELSISFILTIAIGCGIYCVVNGWSKARKEVPLRKEKERHEQLVAFYQECVKYKCLDMVSEQNRNRAKLVAEHMCITHPKGIEKLFEEAEREMFKDIAEQADKVKRERRKEEEKEYKKLNQYASYTGRDKRIAMVRDAVAENRRTAEALERTANGMLENSQQREHNAATWGGIANGLAGAGAGVSTALQTELENIQIRANNARRREELLPVWQDAMTTAARFKNLAAAGEELIRKTQVALVAETEASAVLKKLKNTRNPEVEVSITGAVTVNAYLKLGKKETIFGDVPAVADGTIVAQVLDNGQEIAKVNLVCPLQGIGANKEVKLRGMALVNADPKKKYTVAFGASNLWLMEE